MKHKLIVFEGIDGVGKTTFGHMLVEYLRQRSIPVIRFEDVEDKTGGFNLLKKFVKSSTPIDSSLLFYLASSVYKSALIKELLQKSWVVCDRYVYSTLAYHAARGANLKAFNWKKLPIVKPDHAFLLVVSEIVRQKRISLRGGATADDRRVKHVANAVGKMEREFRRLGLKVIDNSKLSPDIIFAKILKSIGL